MKYLAACTTVTAPDGTKTTTVDQAAVNNGLANAEQLAFAAIQFAAASMGISISNPAAKQAAFSDLSGVAAAAQASLGKTPTSANIAQGADSPVIGTAVQDKLPASPITQGTSIRFSQPRSPSPIKHRNPMEPKIEASEIQCVIDVLQPAYDVLLANRESQSPPDDTATTAIKDSLERLNLLIQSAK